MKIGTHGNRYDYLDRRVQKITPAATHTYFYDGWMLIKEVIANTNGTTDVIDYHWGKDLSGTLQGAGGVGGLLYMNFDEYRTSQVWEKVGGNIYWMHLTDSRYENSCALRVSRALVNSGETITAAKGRWVAADYTVLKDTVSRQGVLFKKGTVLHAEKPGSRYELSAENMKGCLDGICTGEKLKEKKHFVQNLKAIKYAKQIADCNDEAFFVGYSTEGRWWHAGMVKKGYQDPHLFKGLMYLTFWRLKK